MPRIYDEEAEDDLVTHEATCGGFVNASGGFLSSWENVTHSVRWSPKEIFWEILRAVQVSPLCSKLKDGVLAPQLMIVLILLVIF